MFDAIAPGYDRLNHILSLGMDKKWRRLITDFLPAGNALKVLDLASGTAEIALVAGREARVAHVTGIDIAESMLALGRVKIQQAGLSAKIELTAGDAMALPFPENAFDAVTVGFGVRNFSDLMKGLMEAWRVLKPGGRFIILELSSPSGWWRKAGHAFYVGRVVPCLGGLFSGRKAAYSYLSMTALAFPSGLRFERIIRQAGFTAVERRELALGAVTIYIATR